MRQTRYGGLPTGWFPVLLLSSQLAGAGEYSVEPLIATAPLHGANGMEFDADGNLIVGSMMSGSIRRVNVKTGEVESLIGPPEGLADDLAIGPDGTLVWTSMPMGIIHALRPGGRVEQLATDLPLINSINFSRDGRLFAAQVTQNLGTLYEIDMAAEAAPRPIVEGLAGLNGFEIDENDVLYGPLMWGGKIVSIDLESGEVTDVADGLTRPVAVNLDSQGNIYAVDYLSGEVIRIDPTTGAKQVIARSVPPIDNLAISDDDLIYISHACASGVEEIDPATGAIRSVARGSIGLPGGAVLVERNGRETLLVAGLLCQNFVDTETGEVTPMPRRGETSWSGTLDYRDGTVVITSFSFGQVQWLDAASGEPVRTLNGFDKPYDVRILSDGSVLVAEQGTGRVLLIRPPFDGEPEVVAENLQGPVGLLLDGDEGFYVTETDSGSISHFDMLEGDATLIVEGLASPEGLDRLDENHLIVAEVGNRRLVAVNLDSGEIRAIAADLPIGMPSMMGAASSFLPTGVAAGHGGNIYVVSDMQNTVLKLTPIP